MTSKEEHIALSSNKLLNSSSKRMKVSSEMERYYSVTHTSKSTHSPKNQPGIDTTYSNLNTPLLPGPCRLCRRCMMIAP
jgi:hypothetical protein